MRKAFYHTNADLKQAGERVYEQYVKPLEKMHWGKYVAVSSEGKTVITSTLNEAVEQAHKKLGVGNFIFKVGEIAVGSWL